MSLPVRKGAPCLSDKEAGGGPETVKDRVKKFVCVLEEEIKTQYKQENILSYLSVFGPGKKTLPLLSPVNSLDVGENGHRYEQLLSSASKRKFGQFKVADGKQGQMVNRNHTSNCSVGINSHWVTQNWDQ